MNFVEEVDLSLCSMADIGQNLMVLDCHLFSTLRSYSFLLSLIRQHHYTTMDYIIVSGGYPLFMPVDSISCPCPFFLFF